MRGRTLAHDLRVDVPQQRKPTYEL